MVKNEEFYSRAQELRDYYKKNNGYLLSKIVSEIVGEVFDNGDEFPPELTFSGHHYQKYMVESVLKMLKLDYKKVTQLGDFFVINGLKLMWAIIKLL